MDRNKWLTLHPSKHLRSRWCAICASVSLVNLSSVSRSASFRCCQKSSWYTQEPGYGTGVPSTVIPDDGTQGITLVSPKPWQRCAAGPHTEHFFGIYLEPERRELPDEVVERLAHLLRGTH